MPVKDDTLEMEEKRIFLQSRGELIEIAECQWKHTKQQLKNSRVYNPKSMLSTFYYSKIISKDELLQAVMHDEFYGFLNVDLSLPEHKVEEYIAFGFPPLFQKIKVDETMLSSFMNDKINTEGNKTLKNNVYTLTFNGNNTLIYTELLKFYIKLGYVIDEIHGGYQFCKEKPLLPFIEQITDFRIKATREKMTAYKPQANL